MGEKGGGEDMRLNITIDKMAMTMAEGVNSVVLNLLELIYFAEDIAGVRAIIKGSLNSCRRCGVPLFHGEHCPCEAGGN